LVVGSRQRNPRYLTVVGKRSDDGLPSKTTLLLIIAGLALALLYGFWPVAIYVGLVALGVGLWRLIDKT
jgi:hypothetical protein